MKKPVQTFMLVLSLSVAAQSFAAANTGSDSESYLRVRIVRQIVDKAARETSTEPTRKQAVILIQDAVSSLTPDEQEKLFTEITEQLISTNLDANDREMRLKDSASISASLLAVGLGLAILSPKTSPLSRIAAGFGIGAGFLSVFRLYQSNGIVSQTEEHTREIHEAFRSLSTEIRLKRSAQSLK